MNANLDYSDHNGALLYSGDSHWTVDIWTSLEIEGGVSEVASSCDKKSSAEEKMPGFREAFPEPEDLNDLGCQRLSAAILLQAMDDYYSALVYHNQARIKRLNEYFTSSDFMNISDIPADHIVKTVRDWHKKGRSLSKYIRTCRKWVRDKEEADQKPLEYDQYVWPNYIHDLIERDKIQKYTACITNSVYGKELMKCQQWKKRGVPHPNNWKRHP